MKKSSNISKYVIDWQVIRTKARKIKELKSKLSFVLSFYHKNNTYDYWERVYNWAEGLLRGYKACKSIPSISEVNYFLIELSKDKPVKSVLSTHLMVSEPNDMKEYDEQDLKEVFFDLYNRNKKCLKGYYHEKELNIFLDNLYETLGLKKNINLKVEQAYRDMLLLRINSVGKKSIYKFVY